MATRYGGGKGPGRRYGVAHVAGAVVVITAAAVIITFNVIKDRQANVGTAQEWSVKGPPCPSMTAEQFAAGHYTAKKTFDYDGITIGRLAGDANCSDIKDSGGKGLLSDKVCQFTSPANLTVKSGATTYYFVPDVGHPATLVIHKGVPTCVLASNYTLKTEN